MSGCVECNHPINALSHERCRTHADCANGRQYHGAICGLCQSLWHRARCFAENPGDARRAFIILNNWIAGFGRNSRGRPKGVDYFSDFEERAEFEKLRAVFQITRRASSLEGSLSSITSQGVSVRSGFHLLEELHINILRNILLSYALLPAMLMKGTPFVHRDRVQWGMA